MKARLRMIQGMLLALAAPLGWLALRAAAGSSPKEEWTAHPGLYLYLWLPTTILFALFGSLLGSREDRLQEQAQRLRELATVDPLTELCNRRYFLTRLEEQCLAFSRHGRSFALLVLDLDGLSRVNERLGSSTGDGVLVTFARTLDAVVRRSELVARIGEGEFALLMPDASLEDGRRAAERLRAEVEAMVAEVARLPQEWTITLSVGCAASEGRDRDLSAADILAAAEQALAAAKAAGGNRVEIVPPAAGETMEG